MTSYLGEHPMYIQKSRINLLYTFSCKRVIIND